MRVLSFSGDDTKIHPSPRHRREPHAKLPGVRRVSPGHYSVTGPVAKISPAPKTLTAAVTVAHYNKPVTITAP